MAGPAPLGLHRDDRQVSGPRVLVIDDEEPLLLDLLHQLRADDRLGPVDGTTHGLTALRHLTEAGRTPDAVFLDVRMPGVSGPDLARLLARFATPPVLVFVTAHGDFAVDAFELKAVDYVLKPVRAERLAEAVRRVLLALEKPRGQDVPDAALPPPPRVAADEMISVELGGRTQVVPLSSVRWAEAQGDHVRLHTAQGSHLLRAALAALEKRWADAGFVRIHRSRLVALKAITALRVDGGAMTVVLGDVVLAVSRRHASQVRDLLVRQAGLTSRRR